MLSVAAGVLLATLSSSEMSEAWYSEVMLGRLDEAYLQYQGVYLDESRPWKVRALAALRAGGCAEKLGEIEKAIAIYLWFEHEGDANDPMVRRARLRKEILQAAKRPSRDTPEPPFSVRAGYLDDLRRTLNRRRRAVDRVAAARRDRDLGRESIENLQRRLRSLGVQWRWVHRSGTASGAAAMAFVRSLGLDAGDETMLRRRLADAFYLRALRALRDQDLRLAVDTLRIHSELAPEPREDADALAGSARRILGGAGPLRAGAAERVQNEYPRLRAVVSRQVSECLDLAEDALREGDGELSLDYLGEIQRLEDWAPEALSLEGRLRDRVLESVMTLEHHLSRPVYEEALSTQAASRDAASDLALQTERFLNEYPGARESEAVPVLEDRGSMLPILRREVQEVRTLLESDEPEIPDAEAFRSRLEDTLMLLDWFPELDPVRRARRLILDRLDR